MSTIADDTRGGMRNVWIITAAMTVLAICYTMIIPFLPIYLLELGVPKALSLGLHSSLRALWLQFGEKSPIIKGKNGWPCALALALLSVMY